MCLFKKRKNFGANRDQSTRSAGPFMPYAVSDASQKPPSSLRDHSASAKTCVDEGPRVGTVHKKLKTKSTESITLDVKKKQLAETQKAMGIAPNTALLERLEKEKKNRQEPPKPNEKSTRSKLGDIAFSIIGKKKVAGTKDDTHNPLKLKSPNAKSSNDPEELVEEVKDADEEEPNSENYMYNVREIHYTVHDMIRTLDKNDVPEATGDCVVLPDEADKAAWDPLAEAEVMEKREGFDCYALRRNTFVSATTCFRNDEDMSSARTQKSGRDRQATTFAEKIRNLNETRPENCGEASVGGHTLVTPQSDTNSLVRTQKTVERTAEDSVEAKQKAKKASGRKSNSKSNTK